MRISRDLTTFGREIYKYNYYKNGKDAYTIPQSAIIDSNTIKIQCGNSIYLDDPSPHDNAYRIFIIKDELINPQNCPSRIRLRDNNMWPTLHTGASYYEENIQYQNMQTLLGKSDYMIASTGGNNEIYLYKRYINKFATLIDMAQSSIPTNGYAYLLQNGGQYYQKDNDDEFNEVPDGFWINNNISILNDTNRILLINGMSCPLGFFDLDIPITSSSDFGSFYQIVICFSLWDYGLEQRFFEIVNYPLYIPKNTTSSIYNKVIVFKMGSTLENTFYFYSTNANISTTQTDEMLFFNYPSKDYLNESKSLSLIVGDNPNPYIVRSVPMTRNQMNQYAYNIYDKQRAESITFSSQGINGQAWLNYNTHFEAPNSGLLCNYFIPWLYIELKHSDPFSLNILYRDKLYNLLSNVDLTNYNHLTETMTTTTPIKETSNVFYDYLCEYRIKNNNNQYITTVLPINSPFAFSQLIPIVLQDDNIIIQKIYNNIFYDSASDINCVAHNNINNQSGNPNLNFTKNSGCLLAFAKLPNNIIEIYIYAGAGNGSNLPYKYYPAKNYGNEILDPNNNVMPYQTEIDGIIFNGKEVNNKFYSPVNYPDQILVSNP